MIYLGSDHGGFDLKEKIKKWLEQMGLAWEDMGNKIYDKKDDYPVFAFLVAEKVVDQESKLPLSVLEERGISTPFRDRPKGILCCRSSAGMVIAANKVSGARAVTAFDRRSAAHSRQHNDANILALSGDWLEDYQVKKILETWLTTEFAGEERHVKRLKMIVDYPKRISEN